MRSTLWALCACALAMAVGPAVHAQSIQANPNAQQNRQKKQPNQVPDLGADDATPDAGGQFDKAVENIPVTVRADGTIVAELDDTFMEAMTVSVGANGALRYTHVRGIDNASRAIRLLPSRPLPQVFPIFEDKE